MADDRFSCNSKQIHILMLLENGVNISDLLFFRSGFCMSLNIPLLIEVSKLAVWTSLIVCTIFSLGYATFGLAVSVWPIRSG